MPTGPSRLLTNKLSYLKANTTIPVVDVHTVMTLKLDVSTSDLNSANSFTGPWCFGTHCFVSWYMVAVLRLGRNGGYCFQDHRET